MPLLVTVMWLVRQGLGQYLEPANLLDHMGRIVAHQPALVGVVVLRLLLDGSVPQLQIQIYGLMLSVPEFRSRIK